MGRIQNDRLTFKMRDSRSKRQACMQNDGLTFEMTGSHVRWGAHVWNDGLTCKMMGSRSKWRARMQDEGLIFKMMGSRAKWQAHIQNNRPTCKMTGLHSKQQAHMQNDGLTFEGSFPKWHVLVSVDGVHKHHVGPNLILSSGGGCEEKWGNQETSCLWFTSSRTWWVLLEQHLTVICGLAQRQFPRYKSKRHGLTQRWRQE